MTREERALEFMNIMEETYPDAECSLDTVNALQLLISVQLAAQCTDARVNIVTKTLFPKYPDVHAFAGADLEELEQDIKPTGFYHNKAKNIIGCCQRLIEVYGGEVPDTMEDLLSLPGVGRKTANLILGDVFHKGGMVIDTHAKRLLKRVGLTTETDPTKVEFDVEGLFPKEKQSDFCHRLVLHGRAICDARKPKCEVCPAAPICLKKI